MCFVSPFAMRAQIDNELVYSKSMAHADGTTSSCGATWSDSFVPLSFTFLHYGQSVKVMVTSSLDSAGTDESWGIANFRIESSLDNCTSVAYSSSFADDGTEGWTITNALLDDVTSCGECVLLCAVRALS